MLPPNSFFFALGADMIPVSASKPASPPPGCNQSCESASKAAAPPDTTIFPSDSSCSIHHHSYIYHLYALLKDASPGGRQLLTSNPNPAPVVHSLRTSIHPTSTAILAHMRVNHQLRGPQRRQSEHLFQHGINYRQI